MKSRWIAVVFGLLILILLIDSFRRLGAPFLSPQFFPIETKLIYIVLSSIALGAVVLFLLVTLMPPRAKTPDVTTGTARPVRKMAQIHTALQLGDREKALDLLSTIREPDPDYWQARKVEGDLHFERGEWSAAANKYRDAMNYCSAEEQTLLLLCLGHVFEQQDQIEEAKGMYQQVWNAWPQSQEAIFRLRMLAIREQDWNEAMTWQERKEQLELEESETPQESNWKLGVRYELARVAAEAQNYKTSHALLKYIFRVTDYFTPAYLLLADIQERQLNGLIALKTYEQGFLKTQNPAILMRIAEKFLIQNQPQRAIEYLRDVCRNHPADPRAAFTLGDLYKKLEMNEEAKRVFELLHQKHPDWLLNNIALARLYDREGHKERALHLYRGIVDQSEALSVQPWQCYTCNTTYQDYKEFCVFCCEWNSVNLNQNKAGIMGFRNDQFTALPL